MYLNEPAEPAPDPGPSNLPAPLPRPARKTRPRREASNDGDVQRDDVDAGRDGVAPRPKRPYRKKRV